MGILKRLNLMDKLLCIDIVGIRENEVARRGGVQPLTVPGVPARVNEIARAVVTVW
jgi:hypothetical protein